MRTIESISENAIRNMKAAISEIEAMRDNTVKLLSHCREHGISKVAIGVSHESVKSSINWGLGTESSVFADETEGTNSRPAIWGAVDDSGFGGECGNSGQCQTRYMAKLSPGTYRFENGVWEKVD